MRKKMIAKIRGKAGTTVYILLVLALLMFMPAAARASDTDGKTAAEQTGAADEKEAESGMEPAKVLGIAAAGAALAVLLMGGILAVFVFAAKKKKKPEKNDMPPDQNRLKLTIRGEEEEKTKEAAIKDKLTFGRSSDCDITVIDRLLSRKHFMIEKDGGFFYITDLGSMNGTTVNGIRITTRYRLKNGDVVQAGSLFITITW